VVGIPKTIDNDVDLIDRSFGFQTSVEAAQVPSSDATQSLQTFSSAFLRICARRLSALLVCGILH
jgi:6-phosphofructokinase